MGSASMYAMNVRHPLVTLRNSKYTVSQAILVVAPAFASAFIYRWDLHIL